MATLQEQDQWVEGIYQLETSDPVLGGPDGIDNLQAKQLANRTAYLKNLVTALGNNKQPLDATLTALAALATVADKLIYATGPDTFATTTLTAFARTLLDDANATAALATLGAAPVASPTFTGVPAAPTAATGNNTTQIATTAFVQAAIAALISSSPAALDTLNELATALGNDPNFATTITNALAAKAPLASPALTGTPTVPTAAASDSSTTAASTAFVKAALKLFGVGGGQGSGSVLNATWASNNADDVNITGIYTLSGTSNVPYATSILIHVERNFGAGVTAMQITADATGKLYWRCRLSAAWNAWATPLGADSPALTGTPTAPTAAAGNNTTQIATTAFVQAAIAALISSSPAALDTLNELATALGNDPNFATTITNALAAKAPLANPALTGTPTAPTASADSDTTQIATTAFARAMLALFGIGNVSASPGCADIDSATLGAGLYYVNGATVGTFPGGSAVSGMVLHKVYGSAGFQLLQPYGADRLYYRRRTGSAWQAWIELAGLGVTNLWTKGQAGAVAALPATTGTVTLDLATSNNFSGTLTGNIVIANPINVVAGQSGVIRITNGASPYTAVWGSYFKFPGGIVPGLTATAGAEDVFAFYAESATRILISKIGDVK